MANVRVRMGNGKNTSMDVDDVAALASFQIWTQLRMRGARAERQSGCVRLFTRSQRIELNSGSSCQLGQQFRPAERPQDKLAVQAGFLGPHHGLILLRR